MENMSEDQLRTHLTTIRPIKIQNQKTTSKANNSLILKEVLERSNFSVMIASKGHLFG
jgi:hypothetical protein